MKQQDWRDVLLVDGYNMIGAWPELSQLADSGLEEARDRLLHMLADYQAYSGRRVVVVFDAYLVPGLGVKYSQGKVSVYFTKEKETADECIERLVKELTHRRRQIYVATSDSTEQHVAFGHGALRISARELLIIIEQARKEVEVRIREQTLFPIKKNPIEGKLSLEQLKIMERMRRGERFDKDS
ncbi:NYN domain-containing protein [Paenibacillus sp. 481]|uniref:NYN domain-containing protein n=1 Tax=Paenibacillus sp. 481 TaxID=2835869 RepID=UPI001E4C73B4|nr:NYN domain-containing protein [Paenibacillus sp. 481]UHA71685.1 NYN domain-containing protein [Paenibacillus sp. 481]